MKNKILLFFCIFLQMVAVAQTDTVKKTNSLNDLTLEELLNLQVFTASKKLQRESEAPSMITVIQHSDITNLGALTLIDLLKFVPGIETSLGSDGHYRISLRGSRKDGTILVLIDGQEINDFYSGQAIYDLSVDFIEKIEIIRGPGSAIYGSNAMAGVINIFTRAGSSASITGGINSTLMANTIYSVQKNKTYLNLSLGYYQTDGSQMAIDSDKAKDLPWSLTNMEKTYRTNRWNKDGYFNCNLSSGDFHFHVFNIYRQQGTWVGPIYIAAPDSKLIRNQLATSFYYDFRISDNVIITPKIYYNSNLHDFLNQEMPDNYISSISGDVFANGKYTRERYRGSTYGSALDIYIKASEHFDILTGSVFEDRSIAEYNLERNYKIVGDEYKGEFDNYDNIEFTQNNKRRFIFAYFIQTNYKINKINITAGLRYDDYSDFGQSVNPRIGITYNATSHIRFKGLYGRAFRAPTFQELYDNSTLGNEYGIKGNTSLTPENINTVELGAEGNIKKAIIKYNVFYTENNNLIRVYDPHGGGSIGIYENIGNVQTIGNEASLVIAITPTLNFFSNYSQYISIFKWNDKNVRASDVAYYKKQPAYYRELRNSPTLRINVGFNYNFYKWFLSLGANYGNSSENNKRFYLETDHYVKIPFYIQGNFKIGYTISEKLNLSLAGDNLGTKKYSDPEESTNINALGVKGLIQPGPTLLLKIVYTF